MRFKSENALRSRNNLRNNETVYQSFMEKVILYLKPIILCGICILLFPGCDTDNSQSSINRNAPEISDLNESNQIVVEEHSVVSFQLTATDLDGDELVYSWVRDSLPQEAEFVDNGDGTGDFTWETGAMMAGYYEPVFTVTDGDLTDDIMITITVNLANFSFFLTSLASLQELSGSPDGFGGDLRYGEEGPGAGLRGADKICQEIAELSMPGSSVKVWRAFLSIHSDENGNPVNAIDRIGEGPWYDRLGRLLAPTKADLLHPRPQNGDPTIRDDLPNEWGVPNQQPDPNQPPQLNHHTLTGSKMNGTIYPNSCKDHEDSIFRFCYDDCMQDSSMTREQCLEICADDCREPVSSTCSDWTTADGDNGDPVSYVKAQDPWATFGSSGRPRFGLSYPRENGTGQWLSIMNAVGCAAGGGQTPAAQDQSIPTVGFMDGYGGFYCFSLQP